MVNSISTLPSRCIRYLNGLAGLQTSDIWLASYPRSGNSWFRLVINEYIKLKESKSEGLTSSLDDDMPVFGHSNLMLEWQNKNFPRIIKTHLTYNALMHMPAHRILLVRSPFDSIPSYFRLAQANLSNPYSGNFTEFLRSNQYGIKKYLRHYNSWDTRVGSVIFYEDLKADTVNVMSASLIDVGIDADKVILKEAIAHASLDNVKKHELAGGVRDKENRFVKGFNVTGGSLAEDRRSLFTENDTNYVNELISVTPGLAHYGAR